jgi:murein DD-endopeptidase MepM/ murein hydrolase activator NlpD
MTKLEFQLPFDGEWLTFWGGDTKDRNHHHDVLCQRYAFDFIQTDKDGKFYKSTGSTNLDYYSFGKDVLAVQNGVVVEAIDGMLDNKPGNLNSFNVMGNCIMIKHDEDVFSVVGHLKQNSILVRPGDSVRIGQKIAECGNSGNTTDPHLHFHVQDSPIFTTIGEDHNRVDIAKGIKIHFTDVTVKNDSGVSIHETYSPVKNDQISKSP